MVFKNRTHAVTFRLAESEFQELTETASSLGARSLSDFARAAVMGRVALASQMTLPPAELEHIARRLDAFDLILRDLKNHILSVVSVAPVKAAALTNLSTEASVSLTATSYSHE